MDSEELDKRILFIQAGLNVGKLLNQDEILTEMMTQGSNQHLVWHTVNY